MAKHPKRLRDPNQLAKLILDIATANESWRSRTHLVAGRIAALAT
jgi:hypothetical protein